MKKEKNMTHEDRLRELTAENALTDVERAACLAGAEALRLLREAMALTRDAKIARLIDDIVSCADEADGRKADARRCPMNADALEERRRVVLGRLLCEMESLPAPMYGEMVDALRALLATPDTLPPVAVGDVIWQSSEGYRGIATEDEARVCREIIADEIEAVYAPKWQRKETDR